LIAGLVWIVACALIIGYVLRAIWHRRLQLITARGTGVRADLGALRDVPRARVSELQMEGPDVARIVLVAIGTDGDGTGAVPVENEMLVGLREGEPGFAILRDWLEHRSVLGVVMPPETRIIRLRGLDDLQPLTLRRVDL